MNKLDSLGNELVPRLIRSAITIAAGMLILLRPGGSVGGMSCAAEQEVEKTAAEIGEPTEEPLLDPAEVAGKRKPIQATKAALIQFQGVVGRSSEQLLYHKLRKAEALGVDLVVIEIDSPGGNLLETEQIADRLRDLTWAATVAYIPREALSGAAIMSLPCDEVILGPNAEYGDAGAIYQAEGFMFRYADEKFTTALASRVRALADSAGRPAALAEAMVDKDLIVYQVRHRDSGQETCMSQEEIDASPDPERWEVLRPIHESRKGRFFQVTGKRAVELGLADAVANSHDDLKERFALADDFIVLDETFADRFAVFLNHPLVTGLLFIVGLVALYVEFLSPGLGLGGVVSVLCFGLFFWSRFWGGTGDWLEVILFLLGLGLLGVEMFVLPGFGVWGLTGLLLVVVSLIMASEEFVIPQSPSEISSLQFNALVALGAIVLFVVIAGALTVSLNRIPGLSNMALGLPPPASARQLTSSAAALGSAEPSAAPRGPQVGDRGIADSALRPSGKARFGDDYYDVTTEGLYVDAGATVRVIQVQGRNIVVRNCS